MSGLVATGTGTVGVTVGQIVAMVVGAFIVSAVTYIVTKNRSMYVDVHEIKATLITPAKTQLNPRPNPGLIDIVASHGRMLDTLLVGTKALIADSKPNDGSTSKDALNRIEREQTRVASEIESQSDNL
jgi:hypothetical protein